MSSKEALVSGECMSEIIHSKPPQSTHHVKKSTKFNRRGAEEIRLCFWNGGPLTAFKNVPNSKFVHNLSRRLFFGALMRGTQICQKFVEKLRDLSDNCRSQFVDKFLTNLGPPHWSPGKQSSGQILDKFWVWGIFECCKGPEGLQLQGPWHKRFLGIWPLSFRDFRAPSCASQVSVCNEMISNLIYENWSRDR